MFYQLGTGVAQDPTRAAALYQKTCDGGEMTGCTNLGWLHPEEAVTARRP